MNITNFFIILSMRKRIALWILAITVIITLIVSLLLPKQYVATTSIVLDQRAVDPVTGQILLVQQVLSGYIATQADVIASHNVSRKVVESLKLSGDLQMQKDFANANYNGDIKNWIADILLKKLDIRLPREGSMIQLDFTYTDPKFAALIANAFADAYIKTSVELRAQPAKLSADWFDSQMAFLRERLKKAQSVLSSYQQHHGIVEGVDRAVNVDRLVDLEQTRLGDLSKQLVESQARTNELQSRKDLLASTLEKGGSLESLQEVLNSVLIQSLKSELARSGARLAELSQKFKKGNSQYNQAEAQVNSLQDEIKTATKMILNSIESGLVSSIQRDEMLVKALAKQKAKVMDLKKKYDQISVFNHEVENAQKAYDEVMHRAVQTRMESEMSLTDISILNPAFPPPKHAKPKVLVNLVLSIFLGGMLGVGVALLAELMDRRVRSVLDACAILALPVFAVVSATVAKPKKMFQFFSFTKQAPAQTIEKTTATKIKHKIANEIATMDSTASIGALLVDTGKIKASDIGRITTFQKQNGMRFGDAAKALGLIDNEDIQKALSHQFDFPFLTATEENFSRELITAYQPFSAQAEALRIIRGQLMLRWFMDVHKTLALVSPSRHEGRSYIAANLAIVFSQLGKRTLLIDADLRHPRQHELFKLQTGYGLSDVLAERADLTTVTITTAFRDLSVLPAGTVPPNPGELISRGLKNCLQQLQNQFDVILIDTPSTEQEQGIDAQIIASNCGGALLIARQHKTYLNDLPLLKEAMQDAGCLCLGAVLTDFEIPTTNLEEQSLIQQSLKYGHSLVDSLLRRYSRFGQV